MDVFRNWGNVKLILKESSHNSNLTNLSVKNIYLLGSKRVCCRFFSMLSNWFSSFETYIFTTKIKTYEIFNECCVVLEISFPTTLCILNLKVVWKCYGNQSEGGQTIKKSELPTRTQHNTFSHLVMVSTLIFKHLLVLIKWTHNTIISLGDLLLSI